MACSLELSSSLDCRRLVVDARLGRRRGGEGLIFTTVESNEQPVVMEDANRLNGREKVESVGDIRWKTRRYSNVGGTWRLLINNCPSHLHTDTFKPHTYFANCPHSSPQPYCTVSSVTRLMMLGGDKTNSRSVRTWSDGGMYGLAMSTRGPPIRGRSMNLWPWACPLPEDVWSFSELDSARDG